ncbi:amino acid ABC transporter substrate-binding protein [Candidatus Saccharibacteria bacterium]|nr:amino acid ABC transporter substrate-binding protein [Candidatus Saccharibacteria bacterium]MBR3122478.1 amino acid ABC transporter substrate-binding protein [Candidatus Saccharibacteria bacterium]
MHKVKSIIFLVVFLLVTAGMGVSVYYSISGEKNADYVVETNVPFTPFEFYENRQIVGVDVDIVNRVAEKMDKKIQIQNVEFDVIIDNVEAGKIADAGAAGLTITPAREEKVNFTIPYYSSVQYVIFSSEMPPSLRDDHVVWEALAGHVLGSQIGSTGYLFVDDEIENGVLKDTGTTIKGIDSHQLAADAISSHIIDFAIADELVAQFIVEKNPGLQALPLYYSGPTREEDYPVEESYAIAVNKDRPELLEAFNEVLAEMLTEDAEGKTEIDKLVLKYMGLEDE